MDRLKKYRFVVILLFSFQCFAQTSLPAGYPDRSASLDVLPGFIHSPKGYGEVPFYRCQIADDTWGTKTIEKYTIPGNKPYSYGFVMEVQEK